MFCMGASHVFPFPKFFSSATTKLLSKATFSSISNKRLTSHENKVKRSIECKQLLI